MPAVIHLLLLAILAYQVQGRTPLLESFKGLSRYFLSLGLTLFLVNWVDFILYVLLGWGAAEQAISWLLLLGAVLAFSGWLRPGKATRPAPSLPALIGQLRDFRRWNGWFLFFAGFVLIRFYLGLTVDEAGAIWCNFNFVDTPFHLSVMNAFLESPRFPPMDLDMARYPLKYHFLADFHVARLVRLGLPPLRAMWLMNLLSGTVLVVSLWAVFERWLKLGARWVMLAGFVFLFLNPALINLLHYLAYDPPFFNPQDFFDGLLRFPYFNFEFTLANLFEPQRGLVFTLPVVLLILHALFGEPASPAPEAALAQEQIRTLQALGLICLLPFSHIVSFAVLTLATLPAAWRHRRWLLAHVGWWGPVFSVCVLQLLYFGFYGPPTSRAYSAWDATQSIPLSDFGNLPRFIRRFAFWFFVNGDFFFWGALFATLALCTCAAAAVRLRQYLRQWRWFFLVCGGCFLLINYYRYAFAWGDSNKFVLFFNLAVTPVIVLGAAQWAGRRARLLSYVFWWFFFLLCTIPPAYRLCHDILATDHDMILMYTRNDVEAAKWLRTAMRAPETILTGANNQIHFVTALAGRPTQVGIYGDSNPYRQAGRTGLIRRIYEQGELQLIPQLQTKFVCISAHERRRYHLHPKWEQLMKQGAAVVFHAGGGSEDDDSVFIFDSNRLNDP